MSTAIEPEEWKRRYAARVMEISGAEEHQAIEVARVGREVFEDDLKNHGTSWGDDSPEDCADEEMSYWENDE